MSTPMQKTHEPMIGTPVITLDGKQLGYVKELHGGYFKLDVRMARDFWLSNSYISNCNADSVKLSLSADDMDRHLLQEPGAEVEAGTTATDAAISDAEALLERERMEHELEAQKAQIRAGLL